MKSLKNNLSRFEVAPLARRYLVMNGFDGILAALAIIMASIGSVSKEIVLSSCFAMGLALAISGSNSAYIAERAEREREVNELEKAMLSKLKVRRKASRIATIFLAMVNGLSPLIAVTIVVFPFLFLSFRVALYSSIVLSILLLILLGIYLARISGKSMFRYGLQMLLLGMVTACLTMAIGLMFGQ